MTPRARVTVTTIGKPSGMAATALAMQDQPREKRVDRKGAEIRFGHLSNNRTFPLVPLTSQYTHVYKYIHTYTQTPSLS